MTNLKKKATILLFAIFAFVMSMSVVTFAAGAKAEETACPEGTFKIVDKVSIKLNEDGGMRWILKTDKNVYDYISANADVELGFIIAPKAFMDNAGGNYYEMAQKIVVKVDKTKIYQIDGDENYYANGCVIKMNGQNRKYDYTAAAYIKKGDVIEKYAVVNENSVIDFYDAATKAVLYAEEDYSEKILALSAYNWLGDKDFPIEVDSLERYNSLVAKINAGRDFAGRNIEVKTSLDLNAANTLDEGKTFPETMKKVSTVTYYVDSAIYKTEKVLEGAAATATFDKTTEGVEYVFKGWTNESGDIVDLSSVTSDMSVYASYAFYATRGITYAYDETADVYYVSKCATNVQEAVVLSAYDDGKHGEKSVTYVAANAFSGLNVVKVILPESVTELKGGAFLNCYELKYVSMIGVKNLNDWNNNNTFLSCVKLETVIVGKRFEAKAQQFKYHDTSVPKTGANVYVSASKADSSIGIDFSSINDLLTGIVYYKGDSSKCFEWNYDESGNVVHGASEHNYVDGKCVNCGAVQTSGIVYKYDETNDVYYVDGYTGSDKEVYVLSEYEGKAVTYVKFGAFQGNANITKIVLPESITDLDGNVFWDCSNLVYVSMLGVKALNYGEKARPYGMRYGNNNFMNCVNLETVVVSTEFSSNVAQFGIHGVTAEKVVRFFVKGTSGAPTLQNDGLLTGTIYYYSETAAENAWHYVNGVATLWA